MLSLRCVSRYIPSAQNGSLRSCKILEEKEAFSPSPQRFNGLLCIQEDPSLIPLSLPSHAEAFPCIRNNLRAIKKEEGVQLCNVLPGARVCGVYMRSG